MAKVQHLNNAPIREALIDIRVRLPEGTGMETLDRIFSKIQTEYPEKKERRRWEQLFDLSGTPASPKESLDGYICKSADGRQIAQIRLDGFTFNRLPEYENWENLQREAERLWKIYSEIAGPESIMRIALRYINAINLPLSADLDLGKYFTCPPP